MQVSLTLKMLLTVSDADQGIHQLALYVIARCAYLLFFPSQRFKRSHTLSMSLT